MSNTGGTPILISSPEKSRSEPLLDGTDSLASLQERQSSVMSVESNNPVSYQARIEESISKPFPPFAHADILARPYDQEIKRDAEFADRTF